MAKKKVNPRRRPATEADLIRAQTKAINETVTFVMAAIFTVLHDKEGFGTKRLKRLKRVLDEFYYLSESLSSGFVNVNDLLRMLLEETKINLMKDGGTGGQM